MKRLICAACALLILLLPGCSGGTAREGNRYEGWSEEEGEYAGVGLGSSIWQGDKKVTDFNKTFTYTGGSMEWRLNITNDSLKTDAQKPARRVPANYTVFLLNDGILVPFRVEEDGEEMMCFQGKLSRPEEEGSHTELHIFVEPVAVSVEEDTPLSFTMQLSPDLPNEERKFMDTVSTVLTVNLRAETAEAARVPQLEAVIAEDFPVKKVEGSMGGINLRTKQGESFVPIRENQKISPEKDIYVEAETNIKGEPYRVLALVDGKLVNGFQGKYMAESTSIGTLQEGGGGQAFRLDEEVTPREPGDHRVTIFVVYEAALQQKRYPDSPPPQEKYTVDFGFDFLYQV